MKPKPAPVKPDATKSHDAVVEAMDQVIGVLKTLAAEEQGRVLRAVAIMLDVDTGGAK